MESEQRAANAEANNIPADGRQRSMSRFGKNDVGHVVFTHADEQIGDARQPRLNVLRIGSEKLASVLCETEVSEGERPGTELEEAPNRLARRREIEPRGNGERHVDGRAVMPDGVPGEQDAAR